MSWLEANASADLNGAVAAGVFLCRAHQIAEGARSKKSHPPRIQKLIVVQDIGERALEFQRDLLSNPDVLANTEVKVPIGQPAQAA